MSSLPEIPSKAEVLEFVSASADFGNLGVFIGSGFSKAVLNHGPEEIALSWGDLLKNSAKELGVSYEDIEKEGVSFPDIATKICETIAEKDKINYREALAKLKAKLAHLTSWYPEAEQRKTYSKYISRLDPDWIITTNYDLVIESLLTGLCVPLGPKESMCSPKDLVPIYHLHGIRTNPDSIIISQEDYVSLFRPNEYRQIKLALTIKESTVLFIGYGLGDVNVLTALDWSKHVFRTDSNNYPNDVIQLVRKDNPSENPYRDHNGIVILEVGSLEKFFESFLLSNDKFLIEKENSRLVLVELSSRLENPDGDLVKRFIDEEKFRREILGLLAQFPSEIIAGFVSFLSKCIDETWVRAEPPGAFYAYNENLNILIDILTVLKIDQIPPALLETVAYHLNRVGYYVGDKLGMSHEANKTFNARKSELSKEIVQELNSIADQHWYFSLKNLLNRI